MALAAISKRILTFFFFLVLLCCSCESLTVDADSLSCNLSVKSRTTAGQCSVNGETLLQYDNTNQDTLLCKLEKEGKASQVCTILPNSIKEVLEEMCKEPGLFLTTGGHTMNVTMRSQYKQGDLTHAHWAFTTDGRNASFYYLTNKTWRWSHHDTGSAEIQWEANRDQLEDLRRISEGDFRDCIKKLSTHLRKEPRPRVKSLNTTQLSSATQIPRTVNTTQLTSASEHQHTSWILYLLPLIIALIISVVSAVARIVKKRGASPCCRSDHESNGNSVSTDASWTSLEQYPSLLPHSQ